MAEEKNDFRDTQPRQRWAWLELFRGFQIALDFRKLLLAAGGIFAMALGWYLLSVIFYSSSTKPS